MAAECIRCWPGVKLTPGVGAYAVSGRRRAPRNNAASRRCRCYNPGARLGPAGQYIEMRRISLPKLPSRRLVLLLVALLLLLPAAASAQSGQTQAHINDVIGPTQVPG